MPLLECQNLTSGYHNTNVVWDVGLHVNPEEIVCLLGRNGVGKTTLLRSLLGYIKTTAGTVTYDGKVITKLPVYKIARRGISFAPERQGIFRELTVQENLRLGRVNVPDTLPLDLIFQHLPVLKERLHQRAGTLSGGEQQMLVIAKSLIPKPRLTVIDEFSEGLQPLVVESILDLIAAARALANMAMLIVEQSLELALKMSDRIYVMEKGRIVLSDQTAALRKNPSELKRLLSL